MSNEFAKKLLSRVIKTTEGCWEYPTRPTRGGYKQVYLGCVSKYAHRVSYEHHHGPVPTGLLVCHRCNNPGCCNPDHLYAGTQKDNMRDREAADRHGSLKLNATGRAKLAADLLGGMTTKEAGLKYKLHPIRISQLRKSMGLPRGKSGRPRKQ